MPQLNPISLIAGGLWAAVDAHPVLAEIRAGNKIRFDRPGNPIKETLAIADVPELRLLPTSASGNLHNTSNSSTVVTTFTWLVVLGQFGETEVNKLLWALIECAAAWKKYIAPLEWRGKRFVKRLDFRQSQSGLTDRALNRGVDGWSAILTIEVELGLTTADMLLAFSESSASDSQSA